MIDFKNTGLFLASKEFDSAKDAANTLKENRERITKWINSAKEKQIGSIKSTVGEAVKNDKEILTMLTQQPLLYCSTNCKIKAVFSFKHN